uniref:DNA-binding protein inhibitor ID-4 n=1 Tax=Callorhinchus milii TaxID=7868 RepID=V9LFU7_CALMI
MKAISPVRSARGRYQALCCLTGISRSKGPAEEPLSLLRDMNDCYSKLRELVPSIPPNRAVSRVEILQHVIDYIFDLQIVLDKPTGAELQRSELSDELPSGHLKESSVH